MKKFFRFFVTAIPFTVGMLLSLIALCFLLKFYVRGCDFDSRSGEFWGFLIFFVVGFPSMIFGINKLSEKTPNESK